MPTSSFSSQVKLELNRVSRRRQCCRTVELAALFRGAGCFYIRSGERYGLEASFALSATARTTLALLRSFDLPVEVRVREERRLGVRKRYEICLEGSLRLVQFLNEIGVLDDHMSLMETVPPRMLRTQCCRAALLRGALLASGSVNEPGAGAHLEIASDSEAFLETLQAAAAANGVKLSLRRRRRGGAVYSKNLRAIRHLLIVTGAHQAALQFEEHAILSLVRGEANRRANWDQANAARCSDAAARQIRAIRRLQSGDAWTGLSRGLREMAELRLDHPSLTIAELGRRADPPLSKSAVNHRLRRLVTLADA